MECYFNLLCYGILKIPKIVLILKTFLNIKKTLLKKIVIFLLSYGSKSFKVY
jgi:hypothetical protein